MHNKHWYYQMNFDAAFSRAITALCISGAVIAGVYYTSSAWCLWGLTLIAWMYT